MQAIGVYLAELGGWIWFVLSVVLLILEMIVPGIHFMWFGIAAVIVGLLALSFPDSFPWQWQLALFGALSFVSILLAKRYWQSGAVASDVPNLNVRGSQYVGQIVVVEAAISGGRGRVKVGDTVWSARGPDALVGTQMRVTGVDGTVLVVEPA